MSLRSRALSLFRSTIGRAESERALDDELREYAALLTEEKVRAGLPPDEARRAALIELGGMARVKDEVRDVRVTAALDAIARDVRHAVRGLRRQPAFTAVVVLVLALGIGGTTGIFSVVDAALLRPPPGVRAPERLVALTRVQPSGTYTNFSVPDYLDFRRDTRSFEQLAAHVGTWLSMSATGTAGAERVRGQLVTGNYFAALGARPSIGRLLQEGDDSAPGAEPVAVVGYGMWQRAFGADPGVVGRTVHINGAAFQIVGVTAPEFRGTGAGAPVDVWLPLSTERRAMPRLGANILNDRAAGWIQISGRLRDGTNIDRARAEMTTVAAQLERAYPLTNAERHVGLVAGVGLYPEQKAEIGGVLRLLLGAVAVVLLIACANVASLLLVRLSARQREMASRLALGASTRQLMRQSLLEGLVLSIPAGAIGLLVADLIARLATATQPASSALHGLATGVDARVLAFALGGSIATGLAVSVLPALRVTRVAPMSVLKGGGRGTAPRRSALQRALVAGQVALSFIMLATAIILLKGFYGIVTAPAGFDTREVAAISVDLANAGYSPPHAERFVRQAVARVASLPGIQSASAAAGVPLGDGGSRVSVFHPGDEPPPDVFHGRELELGLRVGHDAVTPRYFRTLGIPLVRGRDFGEADRAGEPRVAIVNEELARRFWPGEDAVGQRISSPDWYGTPRPPLEVVGVAADSKVASLTEPVPPMLYVPLAQEPDERVAIIVRSADPAAALAAVQRTLAALDPTAPAYDAATMTQRVAASAWQQRTAAMWVIVFGLVALALGAVGLYGVTAQSVAQRTRELSVRLALGATQRAVTGLVVREGILLTVAGLCIGVPLALALARVVARLVDGVSGIDGGAASVVAALLGLVMLVASWLPARRAARMDPMDALRHE